MTDNSGQSFTLTLLQVINPATAVQYSPAPNAGDNYVGVQLRVTNTGNSILTENPNGFVSVVDSAGTTFSADFDQLSDCPPFGSIGSVDVAPGNNAVGCVAFQVPTTDSLSEVVAGTSGGTPAEWKLTSG
jgi:hypothetical protein